MASGITWHEIKSPIFNLIKKKFPVIPSGYHGGKKMM
jgi:hypothetical protein